MVGYWPLGMFSATHATIRRKPSNRATRAVRLMIACLLLFVLSQAGNVATAGDPGIVIIMSSNSIYQIQAAVRVSENLEKAGVRTIIISANDIASVPRNGRKLYVAIGERAIKSLQAFDDNAIALRITDRRLPSVKYTSTQSDLVTEQPACRHIQLIKSIREDWTRIAVLSSIESSGIAAGLTQCAIKHNVDLQVYAITNERDLLSTLEAAIEDNMVLLAITDPLIYNSRTVKNILLTAYRHRKPVIGYSDSFVQAGAVAAVYTPPESVGDRAAELIAGFLSNNWQFSRNIYHTSDFTVATNKRVAESLGINLPDVDTISATIRRLESEN